LTALPVSSSLPKRRLETFASFPAYRDELLHWLDGSADEEVALYRTGVLLCSELRAAGSFPEHILMELHALGLKADRPEDGAEERNVRDERYLHAMRLLMQTCFGEHPPVRAVRAADGRQWFVLHVREGMRWDPEIEMRRKDWLSCVASDDRRYITPVPKSWEQWSDAELLGNILRAPVDLRGPS
jgi:hypothetical protein